MNPNRQAFKAARAFGEQATPITKQMNQHRQEKQERTVKRKQSFTVSKTLDADINDISKGFESPGISIPPFPKPENEAVRQEKPIPALKPITNLEIHDQPAQVSKVIAEGNHPKEDRTPEKDALWERIDLPSRFRPYTFDVLNVRKFEVKDLMKLHKAVIKNNSSVLYDAVGGTIDQDIRRLTVSDFKYLMYWHRLNSYPKTPYKVTWTSKYENKNVINISQTPLRITFLNITYDEYEQYRAKGLGCPTVRDMEFIENNTLDDDDFFLFERSQYVDIDYPEVAERIQELEAEKHPWPIIKARNDFVESKDVAFLEEIREFKSRLDFGVEEILTLRDELFNPVTWLDTLKENRRRLINTGIEEFLAAAQVLEAQINEIETKLKNDEPIKADMEEVRVNFNPLTLFPGI